MKKNNKGFMLIEVIISTVLVATIMISLYTVFVRVYDAYEKKGLYTNVDGIYALNAVRDYLIDNIDLNNLVNDTTNYNEINIINYTYLSSVFGNYNINKLYIVKKDKLEVLKSDLETETFKDYIDYLANAVTFTDETTHVLLVEAKTDYNDDRIYNYAYLEIKK